MYAQITCKAFVMISFDDSFLLSVFFSSHSSFPICLFLFYYYLNHKHLYPNCDIQSSRHSQGTCLEKVKQKFVIFSSLQKYQIVAVPVIGYWLIQFQESRSLTENCAVSKGPTQTSYAVCFFFYFSLREKVLILFVWLGLTYKVRNT